MNVDNFYRNDLYTNVLNTRAISDKPSKFKMLNHLNTLSTKAYPIDKQKSEEEHSNIEEIMNQKSPITIAIMNQKSRTNSASADHDVIALLSGNQDETIEHNMTSVEMDNTLTSNNTNRVRIRQRRASSVAEEIERSNNASLKSTYSIISRYFPGHSVAFSISNRLASLPFNESVTLNNLMTMTSSKTRPCKEDQIQMIDDLVATNLYSVTSPRKNAFVIKRLRLNQQE